ncbi:hypothetical protein [uncultured Parabacteroides sp.]|uniref:hypothetical protein n=1 Tax=uncultured Parabacteroides sp. TaxID=512312 RepID=UPI0025861826|nr:hypothetical protein [uncultured Parabacteroides sp.]
MNFHHSKGISGNVETTFVNNLNQLITETTTAFNQRSKKGSGSKNDDDRPVID